MRLAASHCAPPDDCDCQRATFAPECLLLLCRRRRRRRCTDFLPRRSGLSPVSLLEQRVPCAALSSSGPRPRGPTCARARRAALEGSHLGMRACPRASVLPVPPGGRRRTLTEVVSAESMHRMSDQLRLRPVTSGWSYKRPVLLAQARRFPGKRGHPHPPSGCGAGRTPRLLEPPGPTKVGRAGRGRATPGAALQGSHLARAWDPWASCQAAQQCAGCSRRGGWAVAKVCKRLPASSGRRQ